MELEAVHSWRSLFEEGFEPVLDFLLALEALALVTWKKSLVE